MPAPRPFRFGILTAGASTRSQWVDLARKVEDLGYSSLLVTDHVPMLLAPVPALVAAADATTTLRVGSYVFGNDFRNPVLLAKDAATIDLLSEGRLELGLGTGYLAGDYRQTGIPLEPPGVRVTRFAEAVRVIKGALAERPFSFSGAHYTVRDLTLRPEPVQRPHPPLIIGGGGRRMLSLAAREADIVSINIRTTADGGFDFSSISPEAFAQGVEWVRAAAGGQFTKRELSVFVPFAQVDEAGPRHAAKQQLAAWGVANRVTPDQVLASPMALLGPPDHLVETLLARRERFGLSYFVIRERQGQIEQFAPVVNRLAGT